MFYCEDCLAPHDDCLCGTDPAEYHDVDPEYRIDNPDPIDLGELLFDPD